MTAATDEARRRVTAYALPFPLLWPRRTAGERLRVVALVGPAPDAVAAGSLDLLAALPPDRFDLTLAPVGGVEAATASAATVAKRMPRTIGLSPALDLNDAKRVASLDPDVLVDLVGRTAPTGALLARRPARSILTVFGIGSPNVEPVVDRAVAVDAIPTTLDRLQHALAERTADSDATPLQVPDATGMTTLWEDAVRAHQRGALDAACAGYERVLCLQPGYAPAHYLLGIALREGGDTPGARAQFEAAVAAAPGYVDARIAAAKAAQATGDIAAAVALCRAGLDAGECAPLWRTLGLVQLAASDGATAVAAFERALMLAPDDADTHYNHGVALQMQHRGKDAEEAYRRALALQPLLSAANFNLGVLYQERSAHDAAVAAYTAVLGADPTHVAAYKNRGEVLFGAGRIDAWLENFHRFEAQCPDALPLVVYALQACHYLADFRRLDGYLGRIAEGRFSVRDDVELVDCLEQLLYLLLFFDVAPATMLRLAQTYDAAARRLYGEPLIVRAARQPGRVRIGYLSADLRNHVMGKMMWQALQYHDKARFELFFYSLATTEDEWTERFRGLADRFEVVAPLSERAAADRIAAADLDLLVDLGTHTKGARPGILALKPARVQLTHVASAGTVGLSAIDFKLTDRYADAPEGEAYQIEKPLPMDGCVYPFRHIPPATPHPFQREPLGIAATAVVIGAFVTGLKLSRRCLALWREVLTRIPRAVLVFSPIMVAQRPLYLRLTAAAGIAADRVAFVPQGRDDAENQARYALVDFVLDPMPYGGTNGTLEALDMGVPVVTLVGQRHCERTSYSILANLGVGQTIARTAGEYVAIAERLAEDAAFMRDVRATIVAGIAHSRLTDGVEHTRALERAYVAALAAKAPEVVAATGAARVLA